MNWEYVKLLFHTDTGRVVNMVGPDGEDNSRFDGLHEMEAVVQLGKEGWEMVAVCQQTTNIKKIMYFKRPILILADGRKTTL